MDLSDPQTQVLLFIPMGGLLIYLLTRDSPEEEPVTETTVVVAAVIEQAPQTGKEAGYLEYNQDEIFKNLIAAEGHFRNVKASDKEEAAGFMNCVVKHLADAEGHADEAISHSIATNKTEAEKYQTLRDNIRDLRHDLQKGKVSPTEGIKRTRNVRRYFEGFNPEFDISKCQACDI